MPSVIIHVRRTYSEAEEVALMDAVQSALVAAFNVGPHDRNIILMAHQPHRFMCPSDRDDPTRYTNVSIVAHASRPMEAKRSLYKAIIENFERLGIPQNCVLIQLHEVPAHDIAVRGGQPMSDLRA
ncbi:tautomerase family protein [Polaromonas sp. P1(28)-8]|nr:tautomerase family protein [Polaromonas sp. P1(28)-8]